MITNCLTPPPGTQAFASHGQVAGQNVGRSRPALLSFLTRVLITALRLIDGPRQAFLLHYELLLSGVLVFYLGRVLQGVLPSPVHAGFCFGSFVGYGPSTLDKHRLPARRKRPRGSHDCAARTSQDQHCIEDTVSGKKNCKLSRAMTSFWKQCRISNVPRTRPGLGARQNYSGFSGFPSLGARARRD